MRSEPPPAPARVAGPGPEAGRGAPRDPAPDDLLPLDRVSGFLAGHPGLAEHGPAVSSRRVGQGQSNLTFRVTLASGHEVVVRRPPPGPLPPRAHDVLREYRVLAGLHGTAVPVPAPLAACEDPAVIGVPFIVMAALPGDALRSRTLPPALAAAPDSVRRNVGEQLVDVLVALRSVVPDDVGLGDLGPRSGYLTRQLTRWSGQLEHARVRPIPDLEKARDWLQANRPPDADDPAAARVVHGDFKLDNALFTLDSHARLLGIVDWEMATLGDPLADLAWLIAFWRQADDPPPIGPVIARTTEIPGFATRDDLVRRYVAATGADVAYLRWFVVLALWKMAVLLEGHWARHVRGTAGAFDFGYLGEAGPELQRRIVAYARGERDSVV